MTMEFAKYAYHTVFTQSIILMLSMENGTLVKDENY